MSAVDILQAPKLDVNRTATGDETATSWEESYKPLPVIFLVLLGIWAVLLVLWCANTWTKRRFQLSNLQWSLTAVPLLKTLVLSMSLVFWYSCLSLDTCSFWVAFGVFVSRIFFETSCFVAFLLLAHGFCITHEQLALTERRKIAVLAGLLYLTLTGYKAALPQFSILVVCVYLLLLYCIFQQSSINIAHLHAQQQGILEDGLQGMYSAVHDKYVMLRRFRAAMLFTLVVEVMMHAGGEGMADEYWIRLLLREALELGIFVFIGWTFRSRQQSPFFAVMPTVHDEEGPRKLPPIHSVAMDEKEFRCADFRDWHIGVPAGFGHGHTTIVIVQNPCELMMRPEPIPSCHVSTPSVPVTRPQFDCHRGHAGPTGFGKAIEERLRATFGFGARKALEFRESEHGFGTLEGPFSGKPELRYGWKQDCSPDVKPGLRRGSVGGLQTGDYGGVECSEKRRHDRVSCR